MLLFGVDIVFTPYIVLLVIEQTTDSNLPAYDPKDHGQGPQEEYAEIPPNLYHECAERMMEFQDRVFAFICGFKGNKMLAFDVVLLALKKFHLLGCDDDVQLARRFGVTKQHVNKIKVEFLTMAGLMKGMGDRTAEARQNFKKAREAQLA